LAMYVSRIFGHVSRHEIHKALQFKDPLPRTPVKMYLLVSKSGFRDAIDCMAGSIEGLKPLGMGEVFTDAFGRRLSGLPFQTLPRARGLKVITSEQGGDGLALKIVECVVDLLVIAVIEVRPGRPGRPSEPAKGRQLIACLDQGFNPDVDQVSQDIFAVRRIEERPNEHPTTAIAKGCDAEVSANVGHVGFSKPPLLVPLQGIVWEQHAQSSGKMLDQAWRQAMKSRKVAEALERF